MSRHRAYCLTINNYTEVEIQALQNLKFIKYGLLGKEVGKSGTPHLQGYIQLKNAKTMTALIKQFHKIKMAPHLEPARGNYQQNYNYCSKDGEIIEWGKANKQGERNDIKEMYEMVKEGKSNVEIAEELPEPYVKYYKAVDRLRTDIAQDKGMKALKEQYEDVKMQEWQEEVVDKVADQDDRQITWVVDLEGNKGKTWLAKWFITHEDAYYVQGGKSADIAYAYNYQETVVFDFTRSQEDIINYSVVESFKNGILFSPKYNSVSKIFKPCKVVCFSNFEPDRHKLSEDRWDIVRL